MSLGALIEPTPVTLPDGTTVLVDEEGRVVVPAPPSAWDIFWRDPGGEIISATGRVATGVGTIAGAAAGGVVGGAVAGTAETVVDRMGPWLWVALGAFALLMLKRR